MINFLPSWFMMVLKWSIFMFAFGLYICSIVTLSCASFISMVCASNSASCGMTNCFISDFMSSLTSVSGFLVYARILDSASRSLAERDLQFHWMISRAFSACVSDYPLL